MRWIATLLLFIVLPAKAGPWTDLWWNPNESGWGVNVAQQNDVMFATMFVYGNDGSPTWYVASDIRDPGNDGTWTGALYRVTGPWFGAASFNPSSVNAVQVGNFVFIEETLNRAVIQYVINGTFYVKTVVRQSWRVPQLAGVYDGYSTLTAPAGCPSVGVLQGTVQIVIQDGANGAVQVGINRSADTCLFTGTKLPAGTKVLLDGNVSCGGGPPAPMVIFGHVLSNTIAARYVNTISPSCNVTGAIVAIGR